MGKRTQKRIAKLVELFEAYNPKDAHEIEKACKVRLIPIPSATGAFKDVYYIKGYPVVVKVPKTDQKAFIYHSSAEIRTVRHVLKSKRKYKVLHDYMPEIFYGNVRTGVIVMRKYRLYGYRPGNSDRYALAQLIRELCDSVWPFHKLGEECTTDIGTSNIAKKDNGYPVIIDLGYFLPEGQNADYL